MSEVVERVARALYICDNGQDYAEEWDGGHAVRFGYIEEARAAIAAMREPTEAMVRAARPAFEEVDNIIVMHAVRTATAGVKPVMPLAYQLMIDAALSDAAD